MQLDILPIFSRRNQPVTHIEIAMVVDPNIGDLDERPLQVTHDAWIPLHHFFRWDIVPALRYTHRNPVTGYLGTGYPDKDEENKVACLLSAL